MSEKQQRTAARTRERMSSRYSDGLHHKHNKNHNSYRLHYKTHPVQQINNDAQEEKEINSSTGLIHEMNLRKIRKRLDKGRFH